MHGVKIFAVYLKVTLTEKPAWFGEFLSIYFEPVDLHITLIQPRCIEDEAAMKVKSAVKEIWRETALRKEGAGVSFDRLNVERMSDGEYVFMLQCEQNDSLGRLQRELRAALNAYDAYVDPVTIEYEENFVPHITIADHLDKREKEEAERYFLSSYRCEAVIEALVVPIVKDQSVEERSNPAHQSVFKW